MPVYSLPEEYLDNPDVAVVGMAVRLPGAEAIGDFWNNLRSGVESIRRLSREELIAAGEDPALLNDPNYVPAAAVLDRLALFDAGFFGFSKREASVLDPQHRHFLEVCFEALEDAGIAPSSFGGAIGVFGGSGMNAYMPYNLFTNPELMRSMGLFLVRHTGNDKDFLTTRVSYCLNLKGPSVNVQTACSTSLVAIHLACQSLLASECDVALAGGVTIELPHNRGYRFEEGEILSPDGHCRPFEARSRGTVFGSGAGVVVLKRLRDAVENGDFIRAIIKGSAVNNDGNRKVGYLAPSVDGQADCVVEALQVAGLSARDISYIECHGTGTPVGDPIEITALARAFARSTKEKGFCGIGSVKSNIGHLDTAAGVASFVKVVHMLENEELAPTLHFEKPNPEIDFSSTPFFVAAEARRWPRTDAPRRAGVSSLGVGGTNAHVIVEEAPRRTPAPAVEKPAICLLSARSQKSLDALSNTVARHCNEHPELGVGELSSSLLLGRERFPFRRVLAAPTLAEAASLLGKADGVRVFDVHSTKADLPVIFLFPGGGAQHANMARETYANEPKFRETVDECLSVLERQEKLDLAPLMFPPAGKEAEASRELERPSLALPALLTIELAFARMLESLGIEASAMLGHSLGEYAAAHLSGVMSLAATLGVVCTRGRLFEKVKKGGMLSVPLAPSAVEPLLGDGLALAAVNAPELCVVSGENARLDELEQKLQASDVQARRLHIDVPAHSPLLDPILSEFRAYLAGVKLGMPTRPYVSNLTGAFITDPDISHEYFVRHLRSTVRFADGLATILAEHKAAILVEVGPGQTLSSLARLQPSRAQAVVPLSPHVKDTTNDAIHFRTSVGRIVAHGGAAKLDAVVGAPRRIVPLPATPFEHERHWVEPGRSYFMSREASSDAERENEVDRWFFTSAFREEPRVRENPAPGERWLVFAEGPLAQSLPLEVAARGASSVLVTPAERTEKLGPGRYALKLSDPQGYDDVMQSIIAEGGVPGRILHALCLAPSALDPMAQPDEAVLDRCFFSLFHLAQVLGQEELTPGTRLLVAGSRVWDVAGSSTVRPLHALAEGPVRVIPKEIPDVTATLFDVPDGLDEEGIARSLVDELLSETSQPLVAERGRVRYVGALERVVVETGEALALPERPVVLFTGGLGGIARTLAAHFVATRGARIALVSRSRIPEGAELRRLRASLDERDPLAEQLDSLIALEAAGAEVVVERADVSVADDVRAAVESVRRRFGHIDVAVHAAGVLDDAPIALKDRASVRGVFAPKMLGAKHLAEALAGEPPKLLLLLSSTSAALGPPGQVDYVAANAYVNALARRIRQSLPSSRVVALGFGVWRDTGMAARALGGFAPRLSGEATAHPLLEREQQKEDGSLEFQSLYDPAVLWVLDEHRVRGASPVLPGTATLEIVRAAGTRALGVAPGAAVELRDVLFLSPLEVPDGERRLVRVLAKRSEDGAGVEVTLASRGRDDRADVQHASGTVVPFTGQAPADLPVEDLETRSTLRVVRFEEGQQQLPQDQYLSFGPRWRVIREMRFGLSDALARISVPERLAGDLTLFGLHPGVLDMVSGFAFSLADPTATGDRLRVPLSYQHVRIHAPLERELVSYVRLKQSSEDGIAVFDVWVANTAGRVLLEIQGYTTKSVAPGTLVPAARAAKEPTLLERWAKLGITREEGAQVVERVLSAELPAELYATPVSLYTLLEEVTPRREPTVRAGGAQVPESERARAEDAPRDDVERRLADMWCSLLGLESVGIHDNFFELGGHSLIAVRLFARIKKAYGIDLPLAILFQAPTIEKCADLLRRDLGIELKVELKSRPSSSPTATVPARAFSHVVSIQEGNGTAPFFCVHGAGGNVLNFRLLAQHLGREQAFFGLQARGVTGDAPLETVEEMANVYLEEIRAVRPSGPYLLGGYSGGGVVAYEIAQRLRAEGAEVPLLVFLDTFHPSAAPRKITFGERMDRLLQEGPRYLARHGKGKVTRHLSELSTELKLLFYTSNELPLPLELREYRLFGAFRDAASRYRPQRYDGHVLMFRARLIDDIYRHMGPTLGWRDIIADLEIVEVPGGHDSLVLEPNVQVLTAHLAQAIARATSSIAGKT